MRFKLLSTEVIISYLLICLSAICIIMGILKEYICCLFAVIIHETGHLIPMYLYGYSPDKITITLFEISIFDKFREKRTFKENLIIIFSGPFANFICFIPFYLLYLFSNKIFMPFAFANLSVCLFNLLPVMSLDGGQLLYLILSRHLSDRISEKIINAVTFIFLFPLAALGFLLLFSSKYNFSLLFICVYLIFSLVCRNNRYY